MEVKNEPVDREYNEEGYPPDDGWYHVPIVKPEALETFEGASLHIKSEFQTDIGQPIFKEEVAPRECSVNSRDSKNNEKSTSFASDFKNQIPAAENSASSLRTFLDNSPKTSPVSFDDIQIDEIDVKKEALGHRPIVVVINLEKKVFSERNFVCSICMKLFRSFGSLSLHINANHESTFRFEADKIVKHSRDATLHRRLDHSENHLTWNQLSDLKPFKCELCDYQCSRKKSLKTHTFLHTGEKPFKCKLCDYKSEYRWNLKTHLLSHTGDKPFKCDMCDFKSVHKSNLKTHKLSHTGEKPFKCEICDYKSTQKSCLKAHKLLHTGDKPFECDICDFRCVLKSNLKIHKLSHTGEKPFKCEQCDYQSARKSSLKVHKFSHTGEKPFECDQCDYKSVRKSSLQRHNLMHAADCQ